MKESSYTPLPTTKSSIITEDKGTFLGLEGAGFFIVFGVFVVTAVGIDLFTSFSGFPVALLLSTTLHFAMRAILNGKPKNYLKHWISHQILPKRWSHQNSTQIERL